MWVPLRWVVVAGFATTSLLVAPAGAVAQQVDDGQGWLMPVDAAVVDPFRAPATRFSAGNRGIEYATSSGDPVRAVDDGQVVFAGRVGGSLHVTLDHDDGLRSTYAFVESIAVVRGQWVGRGTVVAIAASGFHLTARLGEDYVDPALLFAGATVVVALVDAALFDAALFARPTSAGTLGRLPPSPWHEPWMAAFWSVADMTPARQAAVLVESVRRWSPEECTESSVAVGSVGAGRILVQVAGLGSNNASGSIGDLDALALGYGPTEVLGFSYAGGATPIAFGMQESVPGSLSAAVGSQPYGPADTYAEIDLAARRLADLIEAVGVERPGQPIDIAAHSLGGVIARRALEILVDRPGAVVPDTVVTIGSPHAGADLATAAVALGPIDLPPGWVGSAYSEYRNADSVRQVAELGIAALVPPTLPPPGVRVVSIGGAVDVVVPLLATAWDGAEHVIVSGPLSAAPSMHSDLPGLGQVAREFALAVSDRSPGCRTPASVVAAVVGSQAIVATVDAVTTVAGVSGGLAELSGGD